MAVDTGGGTDDPGALSTFRRFFALDGDVLVLSVSMFAFSLGFQMTGRYMPRYLSVLGAGGVAIGLYGSFGNLVSAVYPYPQRRALGPHRVAGVADRVRPRLHRRLPRLGVRRRLRDGDAVRVLRRGVHFLAFGREFEAYA